MAMQAQVSETLMKRNVYACEVLSQPIASRLIRKFDWSIAKLYRYAKRVEPERGRRWRLVVEDAPADHKSTMGSP